MENLLSPCWIDIFLKNGMCTSISKSNIGFGSGTRDTFLSSYIHHLCMFYFLKVIFHSPAFYKPQAMP